MSFLTPFSDLRHDLLDQPDVNRQYTEQLESVSRSKEPYDQGRRKEGDR